MMTHTTSATIQNNSSALRHVAYSGGWSSAALFILMSLSLLVKKANYVAPVMVLLASLCTWHVWRKENLQLPRLFRYFFIALVLLGVSWMVDSLLSGKVGSSFDKPLKMLFVLPCALYLLWQPPRAIWLWLGAALGAIACGLFGIYQVQFLQLPRAGGEYINPIEFGDTCTQLAFICLCGTQVAVQHKHRIPLFVLMIVGFTLGMTGSVLSGTRGAWLAALAALTFLVWWHIGRYSKRLLAVTLVGMAVAAAALTQYPPIGQRLQVMQQEINSYRHQGFAASSVGARMQMWQFATEISLQRPLLGWTQKGYDAERLRQVEEGKLDPLLAEFNHAHQDYLDTSAKRGLVGLVVLLACHLTCFAYFWHAARAGRRSSHVQAGWQEDAVLQALCLAGMLLPVLFAAYGLTDTHITSNRTMTMYFYLSAFIMAMVERCKGSIKTDNANAPTIVSAPVQASAEQMTEPVAEPTAGHAAAPKT